MNYKQSLDLLFGRLLHSSFCMKCLIYIWKWGMAKGAIPYFLFLLEMKCATHTTFAYFIWIMRWKSLTVPDLYWLTTRRKWHIWWLCKASFLYFHLKLVLVIGLCDGWPYISHCRVQTLKNSFTKQCKQCSDVMFEFLPGENSNNYCIETKQNYSTQ